MSFISESQLSSYRRRTKIFSANDIINLNESYYRTRPMVFLSHKHDEQETLQDVVAFLKEEGVDVYVDWMDPSMPAYTNAGLFFALVPHAAKHRLPLLPLRPPARRQR